MRLARLAVLAVALGAPLRAQDVTPRSAAPLSASLHFVNYGDMWFESNQPAYFAIFELTHDRLLQLHPYSPADRGTLVSSGFRRGPMTFGRPNVYMAQREIIGSGMYRYASMPGSYPGGEMHTLLLVASTKPLAVGSPMDSYRLQTELSRRGHSFDLDREAGIDALINLITPDANDDEVAVDLIPLDPSQFWYSTGGYDNFGRTLYCPGRFFSVYDWTPWQFTDYGCNDFYLNPWFRPTPNNPGTPVGPTRATETMVAMPVKLLNDGHSTTNPEEIRRIIDQLKAYDAARAWGTPTRVGGMGGAEVVDRQTTGDSRRTLSDPAGGTRTAGSGFGTAPVNTGEVRRGTGPTSSGRTFSGGGTPTNSSSGSGSQNRGGDEGIRSHSQPQYNSPSQPQYNAPSRPSSESMAPRSQPTYVSPPSAPQPAPAAPSSSTPPPARSDVSKPSAKP